MEGNQKISDTTQQPFQLQPTEADYIAKASNCRFPGLVHKMLDSADPSIVSWIEHGEAFIIKDLERLGSVLEQHFQHRNYSSFQRQLNMYGWKKYSHGRFKGAFFHPYFHREKGTPRDFAMIKRKGPPQETSRKRKQKEPIMQKAPIMQKKLIIESNEKSSSSSYRPIKFTIHPNFTNLQSQRNQYGIYNEKNRPQDRSEWNDYSEIQTINSPAKKELDSDDEGSKANHVPLKKRSLSVVLEPRAKNPLSSIEAVSASSGISTAPSSALGSSIKVLAAAAAVFRDLEGKTRVGSL